MRIINREIFEDLRKYKTYKTMTFPGLHNIIFDKLFKNIDKTSKILVLSSGSGAFEARLHDNGFTNIYSSEYDTNSILFNKSKKIYCLNVNDHEFHKKIEEKFDVVVATEVIEHLYSHHNFIFCCYHLLNKGGVVIITTPNTQSLISRLSFLLKGYPLFFHTPPKKFGHISPVFESYFIFLSNLNKFDVSEKFTCCNYLDLIIITSPIRILKLVVLLPLVMLLTILNKGFFDFIKVFKLNKR